MYKGHHEIFSKERGWWIGVTIGKVFLLIYFMFHGIAIILGGIYFVVKICNFAGMGRPPPPPLCGKLHHIYNNFF
jgi:hypothetical protein